jgi:hypothetical protein
LAKSIVLSLAVEQLPKIMLFIARSQEQSIPQIEQNKASSLNVETKETQTMYVEHAEQLDCAITKSI